MKQQREHSIKSRLLAIVAIGMSMLYILSPVKSEIFDLIHTVSHHLQAPQYILEHDRDSQNEIVHQTHLHQKDQISHQHHLLDFINTIFETSNDEDTPYNSILIQLKIDKHFAPKFTFNRMFLEEDTHLSIGIGQQKIMEGYLKKLQIPPQTSIG